MATATSQISSQVLRPPTQQINISFENITYSVSSAFSRDKKQILKGVSGQFKSGELTAIMGPSGAGKSSLLNVLTGYINEGVEGSLLANNLLLNKKMTLIKNQIAYIMQDDFINPYFTVEETMLYAADLKLSSSTSHKSKILLIDDILDSMAMIDTRNTKCNRLSGGQRKRLNISLELINNPCVLYLDEPTSGLDSSSCTLLINKLKGLARSGRTIICTIHQPSASIFAQFDHLYLVSNGKAVYQGCSSNIIPFLSQLGISCPMFHNPADFVMDVITGEYGNFTDKLTTASNNNDWRKSTTDEKLDNGLDTKILEKSNGYINKGNESPSEITRYFCLVVKIAKQLHRDWTLSYLRLILHIVVSILVGLLFQGFGNNGAKVYNNTSYFFICILYMSFTSMMPAALKFPAELEVLKKEHFNNWFKFKTFFFAFLSVHLPMQIIFTYIFMIISYLLSGQPLEIMRISLFGLALTFNTVISELIGLSMGTMASSVNGVFNGSILLAVLSLLGGFLVLLKDFPYYLYYLSFVGIFRYIFEVLVISQYGYNRPRLDCPEEYLYCHFRNTKRIAEEIMGLDEDYVARDIFALSVYTIVVGLITFIRVRNRMKSFI